MKNKLLESAIHFTALTGHTGQALALVSLQDKASPEMKERINRSIALFSSSLFKYSQTIAQTLTPDTANTIEAKPQNPGNRNTK